MENIIINTIPAYENADIGIKLLEKDPEGFCKAIAKKGAANIYILADSKKNLNLNDVTVVPIDAKSGFRFSIPSAAWRAVSGENPLPGYELPADATDIVSTVEDILNADKKTLVIVTCDGKKKEITINKQSTASDIIGGAGKSDRTKAVFLGYPMGIMLTENGMDTALELTTDYALIITEDGCILHNLAEIMKTYYNQCCGQCVFGYEGLYQLQAILTDITLKKGSSADIGLLTEVSKAMEKNCLCHIGRSAATLTLSTLGLFEAEITEHITKKNCKAAYCKKYVTYHILKDKCTGCMECKDACDDDAIAGKKKFVHVIDQDECTQCGNCFEACEYDAIVKAGAIKPRCPSKPIPCEVR